MNIDFDDEVQLRDHPMTVEDIEEMLRRCLEMGVDTVTWRCTTLGRADFRSQVMDRSDLPLDVADIDRADRAGGWFTTPERPKSGVCTREERYEKRRTVPDKCRDIFQAYDPPEVARDLTAKLGLDLYLWFDPFDEYFPGHGNRFLRENPHCQWTSRDGERYFEGLRCYGFPEAVQNHLDVLEELAAYEPDGLYFATSCHSRHRDRTGEWDDYGFEEPVVARYRERDGVDIRKQDFDEEKWHRIKGEFVTEFFEQAKSLLSGRNIKMMLPAPIGDRKVWDYRLFSGQSVAQHHTDWRAWVDRGIADSLIVGEYQPIWYDPPSKLWLSIADRLGVPVAELEARAAAMCRDYVGSRCELYYWTGWMRTLDNIQQRLKRVDRGMATQPLDGVVYHEMYSFEAIEYYPRLEAEGF